MKRIAMTLVTLVTGTHMLLAQGYGDPYGPRAMPRWQRPYEYDRPIGQREGYISPEDRYGNVQRRWEYGGRYRLERGPYRPY